MRGEDDKIAEVHSQMAARVRPAAGGGRQVEVAPERIEGWLARFADRHGGATAEPTPTGLHVTGDDGGTADCRLPFGWPAGRGSTQAEFVAAVAHRWRVGLLLVRRGAHAVGLADGDRLLASKVDTRYVQGRTAAGGWSQQRFARRRANQTRESAAAAAGHAERVFTADIEGLVLGGDRAMIDAVLADRRLAPWTDLPRAPFLDVPEPRQQTLRDAATRYRAVHILLRDAGT